MRIDTVVNKFSPIWKGLCETLGKHIINSNTGIELQIQSLPVITYQALKKTSPVLLKSLARLLLHSALQVIHALGKLTWEEKSQPRKENSRDSVLEVRGVPSINQERVI